MQDQSSDESKFDETELVMPKRLTERRVKSRKQDTLYRVMVGLNILAWVVLIMAIILLHYARPDFITGVQNYWGIEGRETWSEELIGELLTLLQICLVLTIVTIILRSRRNRRKTDRFGINIIILLVVSITSLVTIYMSV